MSDTGDLAEQLASEEDPLRIRLREALEQEPLRGPDSRHQNRPQKHVRYVEQDHLERKNTHPGVDKEAIQIPQPSQRRIGPAERILAIIMTGDRHESQTRGLTGKPLL